MGPDEKMGEQDHKGGLENHHHLKFQISTEETWRRLLLLQCYVDGSMDFTWCLMQCHRKLTCLTWFTGRVLVVAMLSHFTNMKETYPVSAEVAAFVSHRFVGWIQGVTAYSCQKNWNSVWHCGTDLALFTALYFLVSESFVNVAQVKKILFFCSHVFLNSLYDSISEYY